MSIPFIMSDQKNTLIPDSKNGSYTRVINSTELQLEVGGLRITAGSQNQSTDIFSSSLIGCDSA